MSARDAESGSSTYKGGSGNAGGLGNGGVGGGMGGGGNYGGGMGGGAGRNAGIGSRTGLTTGNRMVGGVARGRPGGPAMNPGAWGIGPTPAVSSAPLNRPAVPGLLNPEPVYGPPPVAGVNPVPEEVPVVTPNVFNQDYLQSLANFRKAMSDQYGWGAAQPGPGPMAPPALSGPWPGQGVNPMARNPMELSNYNWSGGPLNLERISGGQGIQSWQRTVNSPPSNRGYGGWNTLGFN